MTSQRGTLTRRQAAVHALLPPKGHGYIREDLLVRQLAGLSYAEVERTLDQLVRKGAAKGFTNGLGPREWRRAEEGK